MNNWAPVYILMLSAASPSPSRAPRRSRSAGGGGWYDGACNLHASSGLGEGGGLVTTSVEGTRGRVYADGDWTRFDNVEGVGTSLVVSCGPFEDEFVLREETRTTTDAEGRTLSSVTTRWSRVGECDNAVERETYREERTGLNTRWSRASYWNDPAHAGRHGMPRLIQGNDRAWVYTDYDDLGHEVLRVEQRGNASVPDDFPYVVSNGLYNAASLANAFVTVSDYEPLVGDSCHDDDAAKARTETRHVVVNGTATVIGRTWHRYTRLVRDGYAAIRRETRRAGTQNATFGDASNAYSYEIVYADTGATTPLLMRNAVAESLDEDGTLTQNTYSLAGGVVSQTSHRSHSSHLFPTYETTETDATYGTLLRRSIFVEDSSIPHSPFLIPHLISVYDSQNRLRSTTYLDGTSLTNAYSCCRLLWRRDREGRRVLRSAQTGTDHLYYAEEDVWLGEIQNGKWKMENAEGGYTNGFRVTQHFFDALGRETNTVVYVGTTPGEAALPSHSSHPSQMSQTTTSYPYGGSDCSIHTDERGKVTIRRTDLLGDCIERGEAVFTNDVEVVRTKSRSYFGGGTSTRREWDVDKFTEERHFDDYLADGRRVAYVVTESSDCGVVTNSVTTYDLLGRVATTAVPGANGSTIVTSNAYEGTTGRKLSSTTTGSPEVTYVYDELGDLALTMQDGRAVGNATTYEAISGEVYRVVTSFRMTGTTTNSTQRRMQQLTELSDALRFRTISVAASGLETVVERSFDPASGLGTEVSRTGGGEPVTSVSRRGLVVGRTTRDGRSEMLYDAFGRQVSEVTVDPLTDVTNRIDRMEYDASGNMVRTTSDLQDGRVAESTSEYDPLNRVVAETDAFGHVKMTEYDALDRTVSIGGDAYLLVSGYDTAGHKTSGRTTRDDGATWDVTQWEYDPFTGLNTAKEYADGSRIAYTHTDNGQKTRTTWARGAWKENSYNARNLVSGTAYSDSTPSVVYAYADSAKVSSAALSGGTAYTYDYDDRLLNTNETVTIGNDAFTVMRTYDDNCRNLETLVMVTNVRHTAKTRLYDVEDRICGYALTNAAGRGVTVTFAYNGSYLTNTVYTFPNGSAFDVRLTRETARKNLVMSRGHLYNGQSVYSYTTDYDLLGRPANAVDSLSAAREWLYNRRSELVGATVGTNVYGYAYDTIGNRLWSSANVVTNIYQANSLNQYSSISILSASVPPCEPTYDADGNLINDGVFSYAYDAENRLVSAYPLSPVVGSLAVENGYDHLHRRVRKIVRRYDGTTWTVAESHTFVWDGMNIVLEEIAFADATTRTCEYFWGMDKSGTEQGAGGVEGLLAVSMDGVFYIPCYDHNGNIVLYVSETGSVAAQYTYDPYGNVIDSYGSLTNVFSFGFSTKYLDRETGVIGYQYRFYRTDFGRWLNRDPIEEEGGENLYVICQNALPCLYDSYGLATCVIKHLPGEKPDLDWNWNDSHAETYWSYPSYETVTVPCGEGGKVGFKVTVSPPVILIHIYFRNITEYLCTMPAEQQHVDAVIQYDNALTRYKRRLESVCDCPSAALMIYKQEEELLNRAFKEVEDYHAWLDSPGGPHGHH